MTDDEGNERLLTDEDIERYLQEHGIPYKKVLTSILGFDPEKVIR